MSVATLEKQNFMEVSCDDMNLNKKWSSSFESYSLDSLKQPQATKI